MAKGNPNRQKMINMMYLVLTALLALNVSKEVLKAFELVNQNLETTNTNFADKNVTSYRRFDKVAEVQKEKAKPYHEAAQLVKKESDDMYAFIESVKNTLVQRGGGWKDSVQKAELEMQSDVEVGHKYFGREEGQEKGGEKLRARLQQYKDKINAIMAGKEVAFPTPLSASMELDKNIDTREKIEQKDAGQRTGKQVHWESYYFEGYPLIANIVMLTKMQNEIKNTEGAAVEALMKAVGETDYKISDLVPIIASKKAVILQGQKYEADIFLGAYDRSSKPDITVNGTKPKIEQGIGKYETVAQGEGVKKVTGNIMVKNPKTGVLEAMKFETEYQVFKGSAVISADAMNVVYIGLDNPISVSVPGFPPDKIRVSITGGTLSGSNGKYIVKPQDAAGVRECVINASVEVEKGKVQPMGRQVYRIKSVPTPKIKYGTLEGGKQSKVNVSVQPAIYASLEGFVFEGVKYDVVEYTYYYVAKGGGASGFMENTVKGKLIDPALKSRIASGRIGDVISINQIRVVGPGGKQKTIASGPTIFLN